MNLIQYVTHWLNSREEGQGLVEYSLIIALVSIAAVVTLTALGADVSSTFSTISGKLTSA